MEDASIPTKLVALTCPGGDGIMRPKQGRAPKRGSLFDRPREASEGSNRQRSLRPRKPGRLLLPHAIACSNEVVDEPEASDAPSSAELLEVG